MRAGTVFGSLTTKLTGMDRLDWIRSEVYRIAKPADLVVFEDLAFAAHDKNHERAGLAILVRHVLWKKGIDYLLVAPTTLKKFVTGSGKGEKSMMILHVYKRWGVEPTNDNEADAIGLLQIGRMMMGGSGVKYSKAQLEVKKVLDKNNLWLKQLRVA
jgi:crossover junction endodeoxyribonuclease RuvC